MPKLKFDNRAVGKARPYPPVDYGFTLAQQVRQVAGGGTSATYDDLDTEKTYTVPTTVTNEADVTIENPTLRAFDKGFTFQSRTPEIATVDQVGQVTYVSDGNAIIVVNTPFLARNIKVPVNQEVGAMALEVGDRVEGSLARHCVDQINAVISGRTFATNGPMYTNLSTRTRNANHALTLAGVDVTCIDAEKPNACLIAPQYGLQAEHYKDGTDVYVELDGTVHTRTVIGRVDIGPANASDFYATDLSVVKYDSPLPAGVTPVKFVPADIDNYLPAIDSVNHVHCIATDQEKKMLINELISLTSSRASYRTPNESPRDEWGESLIVGDSGSPGFLLVNGELAYLTLWTFGGGGAGPNISANLTEIQNAIDTLEGGAGVNIETVDLSGFVDYTNHNLFTDSTNMVSGWSKPSTLTLTGGHAAPDGTNTALLLDATGPGTSAYSTISHLLSSIADWDETYCGSIYMKAGAVDQVTIQMYDSGSAKPRKVLIAVNLTTGTIISSSGVQTYGVDLVDAGDGWYRIIIYGIPKYTPDGGGTSIRYYVYCGIAGSVTDGNSLYLWHPQFNEGTEPKGYQGT